MIVRICSHPREQGCTPVTLDPGYSKVVVPTGSDGLLHLTVDIFIRNNQDIFC